MRELFATRRNNIHGQGAEYVHCTMYNTCNVHIICEFVINYRHGISNVTFLLMNYNRFNFILEDNIQIDFLKL